MLEELEYAQRRGATILGEVIGFASSTVCNRAGVGQYRDALRNVLAQSLRSAGLKPEEVGHINAHGVSTRAVDAAEAQAIHDVFGSRAKPVPVVAPKSYFGNLGAASGMVELLASLRAMNEGRLFRTLNYETPDSQCPVHIADEGSSPGDTFINVNVTAQGQASGIVVRRFA